MLSKEELYQYYIVENHTIDETKKRFNCSTATISRYCKKYNLQKKGHLECSKEELYDMFIIKNMSRKEISLYYGIDEKNIRYYLKKFNIKKTHNESIKNTLKTKQKNNLILKDKELNFDYRDEKILRDKFSKYKTYHSLAKYFNTSEDTIKLYCNKINLKYPTKSKNIYFIQENIEKIKKLSEDKHMSIREIEKEINIPRKYISQIIKDNNIYSISFNGLNTYTRDIDENILNILNDKKILIEFIKNNKIVSANHLSRFCNISCVMACKICSKFNLYYLFPKQTSSEEEYIAEYISQFYDIKRNIRLLENKEIDIFIPKLNIGIEFNGDYWHNEKFVNKNYHQEKSLLAEEKGMFLYHIFEYEWNNKRDQIINQLNNLLGINQEKIYARKCIIKEVKDSEKKLFLEENHLQGNDSSSVKLGLYYNNELVSLMTFVKPRFNKKYEWELSRFCSKAGSNVIGGASKLFKYFINNYNPQSIISYSNIAHTKGKLYETLGFELDSISEPNYVWINNKSILSRYQCQKHKLLKQGYEGNSETEIMHNRKYHKLYDCGNKVWIWKRPTI